MSKVQNILKIEKHEITQLLQVVFDAKSHKKGICCFPALGLQVDSHEGDARRSNGKQSQRGRESGPHSPSLPNYFNAHIVLIISRPQSA